MARPAKPMFPSAEPVAPTAVPTSLEVCADGAFSRKGLAEWCSLSVREIDKAIGRGEIETFNHGRRILIARTEAVRWLAGVRDASIAERKELAHQWSRK